MSTPAQQSQHLTKVEVQANQPQALNWTDIALGISNGSWAVLLTAFLLYLAFRGSVAKYVANHLALMDSLRKTLETHSYSIGALSDNNKEVSEVVTDLAKQLPLLQKTNEDVRELLEEIKDHIEISQATKKPWRLFK